MEFDFPVDPKIKKGEFPLRRYFAYILVPRLRRVEDGLKDERALSKAAILLAAAALESNLAYISRIALGFAQKRPDKYVSPQLDYLRGITEKVVISSAPVVDATHFQ